MSVTDSSALHFEDWCMEKNAILPVSLGNFLRNNIFLISLFQ